MGAMWLQTKGQDRRDVMKLAVELALHDQKLRTEKRPNAPILPATVFLHYHLGVMELAAKNRLDPASLAKLAADNAKLREAVQELQKAAATKLQT